MKPTRLTPLVFAIATLLLCSLTLGQDRGRDDRGRDDRGRDDRGRDSGGRDFDPRDILRQADDNNDGIVEPSEVGSRSGYYIRRAAERAGLDASKPLPAAQVLQALELLRAENNSSSGGSSTSRLNATSPAANGFGAAAAGATPGSVPGFNVPLTASAATNLEQKYDKRVLDYVEDMVRERDVNRNGVLEKNEWTGRWATPAEESDTNKDGVLDKAELAARIAARFGGGSGGSGNNSSSSTTASAGGPPGGRFGPFGGGPGGSSGGGPGGNSSGDDSERYRRYAEGMIRQYDRNRDGKIDKEESSGMRSEHQSADTNKDGIITQEELQVRLQSYAGGSSGGSSSGEGGGRFGSRGFRGGEDRTASASEAEAVPTRGSFRITPAVERLPMGLPDWFLRGDVDGDGQVSMAEYTTTWTDQLAAEFLKLDANGDGIITPAECQAVAGPPRR